MLLAVDLHEYFIDVKCVTVASVLSLQTPRILRAELDTPEADGFVADCDTSLGEKIFDISMT
jgi:hypothetical protein